MIIITIAIIIIIVAIIAVGTWMYKTRYDLVNGSVFMDPGGAKWTYNASENALYANRQNGDTKAIFDVDRSWVQFYPSGAGGPVGWDREGGFTIVVGNVVFKRFK